MSKRLCAPQKDGLMSEPTQAQTNQSTEQAVEQTTEHPHGYTLADEEMERLEEKRASEDPLDPIALDDPVGMSVEKVIGRALIFVVFVAVVGILFAQVACKNIQLMSVATFNAGVSASQVEKAVTSGVSFAGQIVKFPELVSASYDEATGAAIVVVQNDSPRTMSQLVSASQSQAFSLAMSLFDNEQVTSVSYGVCSDTIVTAANTKSSSKSANADEASKPVVTFTWTRAEDGTYACSLEGYDALAQDDDGGETE